ncbi:MAG: hypothetical protein ACLRFP_03675 [Alphaproteobacteria bacterium]
MAGDIFTLDAENNAAVRTVSVNAGASETNSPVIFTTDANGNAAVRIVGAANTEADGLTSEQVVLKYTHMPLPNEVEFGTAGLYVGTTTSDYTRGKIYLREGADLPTVEFELSTTGLAIDCSPADFTTFLSTITENYANVRSGQIIWNTDAPQDGKWFISAFDAYDQAVVSALKTPEELEAAGFEFSKSPSDFEVVRYDYNITGNRDAAVWTEL